MGFMNWLTGRDTKESDLYVDFDKVESVTTRLNEISTSSVSEGFQSITNALEKLNSTPGMDLIGGANPSFSVAEVFESISSEIEQINTSIQTKADDAKVYSEASDLERVGSSAAMILAKAGEGFLSVFEDIGDGVVSVVGWLAPKDSGLEKACEDYVKRDLAHETFSFYYDSEFAKKSAITEDSFISKAATFAGQMGGFIVLGAGISKATKVFSASTNPLLQSTAQFASSLKKIGTVEAALMGMGTGAEESLQKGMSMNQAAKKGLGRAAIQGAIAWGIGTLAEKAALKHTKASEVFKDQGDDAFQAATRDQGDDTLRAFSDQFDDEATALSKDSKQIFNKNFSEVESGKKIPGIMDESQQEIIDRIEKEYGVKITSIGDDMIPGSKIPVNSTVEINGTKYYINGNLKADGAVDGGAKHMFEQVRDTLDSKTELLTDKVDDYFAAHGIDGSFEEIAAQNGDNVNATIADVQNKVLGRFKSENGLSRHLTDDEVMQVLKDSGLFKENITLTNLKTNLRLAGMDAGDLAQYSADELKQLNGEAIYKVYIKGLQKYNANELAMDVIPPGTVIDKTGVPTWVSVTGENGDDYLLEIITRNSYPGEIGDKQLFHIMHKSGAITMEQSARQQGAKLFCDGTRTSKLGYNLMNQAIEQNSGTLPATYAEFQSSPQKGEIVQRIIDSFRENGVQKVSVGTNAITSPQYNGYAVQSIERITQSQELTSGVENLLKIRYTGSKSKYLKGLERLAVLLENVFKGGV